MKTLYFDCFSGISGDMTIGALIDVGVDFDHLKSEIEKLPVDGFELAWTRVVRAGISASKFDVWIDGDPANSVGQTGVAHTHDHSHHHHDHAHDPSPPAAHTHEQSHQHRKASTIIEMIRTSRLEPNVRRRAIGIFEKLAVSEGQVHHMPPEDVEFHEVGAIDSIVDVVGAAIGLEALGVGKFLCSPINVGGGFIHCQHGVYPVPAPATANLLSGATVYSKHVEKELVTPTGAAILAATIDAFAPMDGFSIERVGYGAGTHDFGSFPNCLRVYLGRTVDAASEPVREQVILIETNIDDMTAEQLAYASEEILAAGALDVLMIPVVMKKGRPGHILQVLTAVGDERRISRDLFEETTTIGVRMRTMDREVLRRETGEAETTHGTIRVKVARMEGRVVNVSPEYDDCARIARETGLPFHEIRAAALEAFGKKPATGEPTQG